MTPEVSPAAAGRLDRGTSGVVVLTLTRLAETAVGKAYMAGAAHKEYLALCHGVTKPQGEIDVPLTVSRYSGATGKKKKVKEALTRFQQLAHSKSASLLRVLPETGRTHQIRRHLKSVGHPVVGDERYGWAGKQELDPGRLCLHLYKLVLPHPVSGNLLELQADPPAEFVQAMVAAGLPADAWKLGPPPKKTGK